jgi:hypothetical protein
MRVRRFRELHLALLGACGIGLDAVAIASTFRPPFGSGRAAGAHRGALSQRKQRLLKPVPRRARRIRMAAKSEALARQFEAKAQAAVATLERISDAEWTRVTEAVDAPDARRGL